MVHTRKGYSLVELVVVIIIIGILAAAGMSFGGKQVEKSRVQTIVSNEKIIANDIESAISDLGFLTKDEIDNDEKVSTYFSAWDRKYLTSPLDMDTLTIQKTGGLYEPNYWGISIQTKNYTDPWGNELYIFYLAPVSGESYRIIIASAGPNSKFSADMTNAYLNEIAGTATSDDDILHIMEPRL